MRWRTVSFKHNARRAHAPISRSKLHLGPPERHRDRNSSTAFVRSYSRVVCYFGRFLHLFPARRQVEVSTGFESVPLTENDFQKEAQEAATKIQATFRSYKVRKEVRLGSSAAGSDTNLTDDTDNQRTEMKEADDAACADIDLSDPGLNQAASKIQATFRGHQVRKSPLHQPRVQELGQNQNEEQNQQEKDFGEEDLPDDIKDMDLNDPDLAKAAVKIQATFRGYKTRSKVE